MYSLISTFRYQIVFLGCWSSLPACLRIFISVSVVAGKDSFMLFDLCVLFQGMFMHECVYAFICDCLFTVFIHSSENGHFEVHAVFLLHKCPPGGIPRPCLLFLATGSLQKLHLLRVQCARACLIFPLILHPKHRFEGYLKGDAGDALLVTWGDA